MISFLMNFPILKRLIPSLSILLAKILNKKEQYYKINNLYFFLDILDPIDREIILKKNYETEEIKKLLIFIAKRNVLNFIDIGSNLGYYSFIIRKKFPEIKIFSFEPNQKAFNKLKKGNFVRAMGSPGGMIGHTSTGDIQWLGDGKQLDRNFDGELLDADGFNFDENTKFIVHGARVHQGSSGGPLFDKDGAIIGLNTLISYTAAENIAVSADHIKELMD